MDTPNQGFMLKLLTVDARGVFHFNVRSSNTEKLPVRFVEQFFQTKPILISKTKTPPSSAQSIAAKKWHTPCLNCSRLIDLNP
jgi:hypothetical protein